ncbi:hypothetical protein BC629DRAFT_638035 [Irpex lacteus]|nr:hypothetical protein BC629DRAFT_638035 [Irpex lacteus]
MPPTFCPCNKPILKRPSAPSSLPPPTTTADEDSFGLLHIDPSVLGQPTVRFPPTPALVTRTFLAHPSTEYDRTPIVVAPNACKLPARGCPGRTYLPSSPSSSPSHSSSSYGHSNFNGQERERGRRGRGRSPATRRTHASSTTGVALPPLVPDLTSSSSDDDDSDRLPNPFVNIDAYTVPSSISRSKHVFDDRNDQSDEVDRAFARFRSSQMHGNDDALSIPPTPTLKPTLVAPSPSLSLSRHSHSHTTTHSPSLNLTLSDSPPPVPSPLSNPTSPVSFNMRPATSTSLSSSTTSSVSSSPRASRWERAVRRNGGGERERSSERRSRRKERDGKESKESKEKEGFKRFGDFEGRSVLSGCSLRVDDGGCFGGF